MDWERRALYGTDDVHGFLELLWDEEIQYFHEGRQPIYNANSINGFKVALTAYMKFAFSNECVNFGDADIGAVIQRGIDVKAFSEATGDAYIRRLQRLRRDMMDQI